MGARAHGPRLREPRDEGSGRVVLFGCAKGMPRRCPGTPRDGPSPDARGPAHGGAVHVQGVRPPRSHARVGAHCYGVRGCRGRGRRGSEGRRIVQGRPAHCHRGHVGAHRLRRGPGVGGQARGCDWVLPQGGSQGSLRHRGQDGAWQRAGRARPRWRGDRGVPRRHPHRRRDGLLGRWRAGRRIGEASMPAAPGALHAALALPRPTAEWPAP